MNRTRLARAFVAPALAAALLHAPAARAGTAVWQGGATGDINNPDNWNSGANLAADYLNFGQDATVTMSADTDAFDPFGNKKSGDPAFTNRTVVFNMGDHTLRTTAADGAGKQYITGNTGTTYVFTNGIFRCSKDGSVTNSIYTHASNTTTNMTIVAIGEDTTLVSGFSLKWNKAIALHILNGAKAYGALFGLGYPSEIRGETSEVRFSSSCCVGPTESSSFDTEASAPPHGSSLLIDGATLASVDPASKGSIYVGYGSYSYDNSLVAMNGATVAANNIRVGLGGLKNGVLYTSSNNTFKATGAGTTVTAPGSNIRCGDGCSSGNLFLLDGGATAVTKYIQVGTGNANFASSNNTFKASGAGTAVSAPSGAIRCGYGQTLSNLFLVEDGAVVTNSYELFAGSGAATNNTFKVNGTGTMVVASRFVVGGYDATSADSCGNSGILENGATMTNSVLWINVMGSGNAMSIRSGAAATVSDDVCLGGRNMGSSYATDCGANGRLEVVGAGTSLTSGKNFIIRNSTGDASKGQELFIGDGARVTHDNNNGFRFFGDGNRVVVSNGTLAVKLLYANGCIVGGVPYPATNSTFRIEGSNASLTAERIKDRNGTDYVLVGAPVFEFVIPEGGWSEAPVAINQAFTMGGDTVIKIDSASAKAYSGAGGGTVPLIRSGAATPSITADVSALTAVATLPAGCSLKNEGGVLSVKIDGPKETVLCFR